MWSIFQNQLAYISWTYEIKIYSFVLMSNHFHAILESPRGNLGNALCWALSQITKEINGLCGTSNQLWGSRYFPTELTTVNYLRNTYKYVYQNPVRAGICRLVEEYPYSSLAGILGVSRIWVPLEPDDLLTEDTEDTLLWLNTLPDPQYLEDFRRALGKGKFKLRRVGANRRLHALENDLL